MVRDAHHDGGSEQRDAQVKPPFLFFNTPLCQAAFGMWEQPGFSLTGFAVGAGS